MGFLKRLFEGGSSTPETAEEKAARELERNFATLKDDGVRAKNMGELAFARKCFESALALKDEEETASYLAEIFLRQSEFSAALPLLEKLTETNENTELKLLLAQCYEKTGAADEALKTCAEVLAADAGEARAHYISACASKQKKDYFSAIASLTLALQIQAEYDAATLLRAQVLTEMQQYTEALTDIDTLMTAEKATEDVLLLKGELECRLGNYEAANAAYEAILMLNPFSREVSLGKAAVLEAQDLHGEAIDLLSAAIEEYPDFAEFYLRRGAIRFRLNDKDGAEADMKSALRLKPERSSDFDGEYQSLENKTNAQMSALNPFGL